MKDYGQGKTGAINVGRFKRKEILTIKKKVTFFKYQTEVFIAIVDSELLVIKHY